ncbi:hypothetical protein EGW08_004395 [Elysia chlorotica]|uniref:Thioredoxin domain-containing protein n=1 Tax=Elysia chlorotica TaxID=188477 RepID=A0A3S1CB15_ELYCH|nr:hypothetical protein EGW08_004395 [Elysia chlorotica]
MNKIKGVKMPFISNSSSQQSTVIGWQRRGVRGMPAFPSFKPRYATSDLFTSSYPNTNRYRETISPAQIYSGSSRSNNMKRLQKTLYGLADDKTMLVRWNPSPDKPAFSLEFLQMYLTRKYGPLASIYQQAVNSCLVVFQNPQSAFLFSKDPHKGSPFGRLHAKWWKPQPQENSYYQVLKHIEKAAQTKARFNEVMDRVDRIGYISQLHSFPRALAVRNKSYGPSMLPVLSHGQAVKGMFTVITAEREEAKAEDKVAKRASISASAPVSATEESLVIPVATNAWFRETVDNAPIVIVKFHAQWCGPCKIIQPAVDQMAKENPNVQFLSVDVDELEDLADDCNISMLPTFQFYVKGRLVEEVLGNAVGLLSEKIRNIDTIMATSE